MEGFENGRLQTAARAVGLMQAAFEAGLSYAQERRVFGQSVFDYQLSQAKLARMAALIQAGRQFAYDVASRMAKGEGALQASMVKAYVCRAAEWVTREALQIHGGYGYTKEYNVERYFRDARITEIYEGTSEVQKMVIADWVMPHMTGVELCRRVRTLPLARQPHFVIYPVRRRRLWS